MTAEAQLVAIVPTYNEVANLGTCVAALLALHTPGVETRVCVVDDASPDGTGQLADRLAQGSAGRVTVIHRSSKGGLGSACLTGFSAALSDGADLIAQLDADLSHDPASLATMLERIRGCDVVIGSRYVAGGHIDPRWAWHRRALSELGNKRVVPRLLGLPVSDATSGYRLWRREALERIDPFRHVASSGYGFQVEMCLLAHRLGLRIDEVPIEFTERGQGRSKMTAGVKLAAVRDILALRWRHGGARRRASPSETEDRIADVMAGRRAQASLMQAVRFIANHKRYWLVPLVLVVFLVALLAVLSSSSAPPAHYTLY